MKTKAVRLYGAKDLRLETYELPAITEEEILVKIYTDSVCMSTYKEVKLGTAHKRVPGDVAENPIIIGHEMAGEIVEVGKRWMEDFYPGQRFSIQPDINYLGKGWAPGYSFPNCGGDCTYCILPKEVMEKDCLIPYAGEAFYAASLAEPVCTLISAFKAFYHRSAYAAYEHIMGLKEGGKMAILAGTGAMGLGAIDLALHGDKKPSLLVVTGRTPKKLERAARIFTEEEAKKNGVEIRFVNTTKTEDPVALLKEISGGTGFDDVMVMTPVTEVISMGNQILGYDGCLNFFAGPSDKTLTAPINFYDIHYQFTHICGTSGATVQDMKDALQLAGEGRINPSVMVTHIVGIDNVAETTINLSDIPGGKKLCYTHLNLPLIALEDFKELGKDDSRFADLDEICERHAGLWSAEAEMYLMEHFKE